MLLAATPSADAQGAEAPSPCSVDCSPLLPGLLPPTPLKVALSPTAASGPEDVALYVGLIAVAVCLLLLLLVLILVYCRKKEGLDSDVADSSILTSGFQPVSIKPSKAGGVTPPPALVLGASTPRVAHTGLPPPPPGPCATLSPS